MIEVVPIHGANESIVDLANRGAVYEDGQREILRVRRQLAHAWRDVLAEI